MKLIIVLFLLFILGGCDAAPNSIVGRQKCLETAELVDAKWVDRHALSHAEIQKEIDDLISSADGCGDVTAWRLRKVLTDINNRTP
jgi:hypothetical protein